MRVWGWGLWFGAEIRGEVRGFGIWGLALDGYGLGLGFVVRLQGLSREFSVQCSGVRLQVLGFRDQGSGVGVEN